MYRKNNKKLKKALLDICHFKLKSPILMLKEDWKSYNKGHTFFIPVFFNQLNLDKGFICAFPDDNMSVDIIPIDKIYCPSLGLYD